MSETRTKFEKWLMDVHGLDSNWNEERNCFDDFPAHLAFKAWQAALSHVQAPAPVAAPVQEWQDISTAPKDGTWVLLYWPTMSIHMYPAVGFHHGDEYGWELSQDRDYGEVIPTHWMPLPPSPALRVISGDTSK